MTTKKAAMRSKGKRFSADDTRGGFTIIEVVLVLAIAGLIFLMVFIALPALQRSQRDTQRRSALGHVTDAIQQYQTNNNGKLPTASSTPVREPDANGDVAVPASCTNPACSLVKNYLNGVNATVDEFVDPDGVGYGITIDQGTEGAAPSGYDHIIYIYTKARCNGEQITTNGAQPRDFAVMYKLEGSGTYCQD